MPYEITEDNIEELFNSLKKFNDNYLMISNRIFVPPNVRSRLNIIEVGDYVCNKDGDLWIMKREHYAKFLTEISLLKAMSLNVSNGGD